MDLFHQKKAIIMWWWCFKFLPIKGYCNFNRLMYHSKRISAST